jgi:PIN domain nuclease of toxin-antitoxin system
VKLLLDTHVLLWALLEPQKLSPALRNALDDEKIISLEFQVTRKCWRAEIC